MTIPRNLSFLAEGASSTGVLGTSNGGTNLTSFTVNGIPYATSSSALTTSSNLTYNGTNVFQYSYSSDAYMYVASTGNAAANLSLRGAGANISYGAINNYRTDNSTQNWKIGGVADQGVLPFFAGSTEGMRIFSSGGVSIGNTTDPGATNLSVTGNVVQATAGKGFNFTANTPAAGMTTQLLNWYESGSWTPVLNDFTVSGATTLTGYYARIGNSVTVQCQISAATSLSCIGGTSYITGLPFSIIRHSTCTMVNLASVTGYISGGAYVSGSGTLFPPSFSVTTNILAITSTYFTTV
jgi:hypothetical protein